MAEEDKAQKTEEPTSKRLEEAHNKGQVAKSQELVHLFMLSGAGLAVMMFSARVALDLREAVMPFLEAPHTIATDPGNLILQFESVGWQLVAALFLPIGVMLICAVGGNFVQHRPVLSADRLKPAFNKLSPMKGLKKIFGKQGLIDLTKAAFKIIIVVGLASLIVWPRLQHLELFVAVDVAAVLPFVMDVMLSLLLAILAVLAVIAGLDFLYQRWDFYENQRMSKQEIKDENRQAEGDPQVKARIRAIRNDRARKRMIASVPGASVIITNPTHYAVALRYEAGEMGAPVLVAKGQDKLALRIREIGEANDVPIVENPPLARGLNASVEIGQEIPPEYYRAVAEVIGYVMRLRDRVGRARQGASS
ncbi:MAG: flagellar biosynthesis protein FlhB [Alphaproteobacteria bacterium]